MKKIAVIGSGNFGNVLTRMLIKSGVEVMVIDIDGRRLENVKDVATIAIEGDSTDKRFLLAQDINSFDVVVVAFGQEFETSLLTISALQDAGVNHIVARASTGVHERILKHMQVTDIIMPVSDAAERLCQRILMTGILDSLKLSSDYTIVETQAGEVLFDKTLAELNLREKFNVSLVTINRQVKRTTMGFFGYIKEESIGVPLPDTKILEGDILVIFGKDSDITKFIRENRSND